MQMKVSYCEKMPQKTFISKEEMLVPGLNAGRSRLAPLFYANAVGLMITTTLIYKPAKP